MQTRRKDATAATASVAALTILLLGAVSGHAAEWQRPDSPFTLGEAYPEVPATCETARYWIHHAPDIPDRVTFAVRGEIVVTDWDGALAYLIVCEKPGVQIMCVTYSREGREVGDTVLFAGGYGRAGENRIMLDPCLATPEDR